MYSVSPFWYKLTNTERIKKFSGAENSTVLKYLRKNNIKILPVISNEFKAFPLARIIAKKKKRNTHINKIVKLVKSKNYYGISLNYENLRAKDKDNFTLFVRKLAKKLHANNKILSVHLHAKTSEPGTWNGPKAQNWKALGKVCDRLKIMAYDYHWSTSNAGAIAPPSWVKQVIRHALRKIPRKKIYLGIPLYGYDWVGKVGEGVTYSEAIDLSETYGSTIQIHNSSKSPHFTYTDGEGKNHKVWFEDARSLEYKFDLAKKYRLGGIDFWRLGDEDPKVWRRIGITFRK